MKAFFHAMAASLLVCLISPPLIQAGGDMGKKAFDRRHPGPQRSGTVQQNGTLEKRPQQPATRTPGLLEQGKTLFMSGKFPEAEAVLLQAIAGDETQPEAHFYLGEVYLALEEYRKAESEYQKATGYFRDTAAAPKQRPD